eukprot:2221819-Pyramimonas_sp.AAC.1
MWGANIQCLSGSCLVSSSGITWPPRGTRVWALFSSCSAIRAYAPRSSWEYYLRTSSSLAIWARTSASPRSLSLLGL